jgi:hypothetical protein
MNVSFLKLFESMIKSLIIHGSRVYVWKNTKNREKKMAPIIRLEPFCGDTLNSLAQNNKDFH